MRKTIWVLAGIGAITAGMALAGAATDQRIATMKKIEARANLLAEMADGRRPFDGAEARKAAGALAALAVTVPQEFEPNEPGAKARSEIWSDPEGFARAADRLFVTAQDLDPTSAASVAAGSAAIQATCTACHDRYRTP